MENVEAGGKQIGWNGVRTTLPDVEHSCFLLKQWELGWRIFTDFGGQREHPSVFPG